MSFSSKLDTAPQTTEAETRFKKLRASYLSLVSAAEASLATLDSDSERDLRRAMSIDLNTKATEFREFIFRLEEAAGPKNR